MSRILFENKKVALGFAGAVIAGAALVSGVSSLSPGSPKQDRSRIAESPQDARPHQKEPAQEPDEAEEEDIGFAPDEALIDDTSGFDAMPDGGTQELDRDSRPEGPDDDDVEDRKEEDTSENAESDQYNPFKDLEEQYPSY